LVKKVDRIFSSQYNSSALGYKILPLMMSESLSVDKGILGFRNVGQVDSITAHSKALSPT